MVVGGVPDSKKGEVVDISFLYGLLELFTSRRVDLGMNVVALFMKNEDTANEAYCRKHIAEPN